MKKIILLFIVAFTLISCVTTTSSNRTDEVIFSAEEYSVMSFEENTGGYLLTFSSIEDSVPNGAMIHISVGNSGQGQPYKKGVRKYQFGNLGIPDNGSFNMEFGIGIPDGNQLTVRSKATFLSITKQDIENGFANVSPTNDSGNSTDSGNQKSSEEAVQKSEFVVFTVSEGVNIPDDKSYAGPVPVMSGVYLNSRNKTIPFDQNMGEAYSGNGSTYDVRFTPDYENETWSIEIDSNQDGVFEEQELVQGDGIDVSDLKIVFSKDSKPVAYLVQYDMGYELYVYLGGKSYMIFLEYCEDC